jgi:hypothetical protein
MTISERTKRPSALLVPPVAEVHQFPDRLVLVGLDQLPTPIPGDLDVIDESQAGTVEARSLAAMRLRPLMVSTIRVADRSWLRVNDTTYRS